MEIIVGNKKRINSILAYEQGSSIETALMVENLALSELRPFPSPMPFRIHGLLLTALYVPAGA